MSSLGIFLYKSAFLFHYLAKLATELNWSTTIFMQ